MPPRSPSHEPTAHVLSPSGLSFAPTAATRSDRRAWSEETAWQVPGLWPRLFAAERYALLSLAHSGRSRHPGADFAGAWLPGSGDRRGLWSGRTHRRLLAATSRRALSAGA